MTTDLFLQVTTMGLGNFLLSALVLAIIAYLTANFLNGVTVKNFTSAFVLAIVLALLNATVGWLLSIFAVPIDFLTFGLFSGLIALVINAIIIKIADHLLDGFKVRNFWWALGFALILSFVTGIFNVSFGVNM